MKLLKSSEKSFRRTLATLRDRLDEDGKRAESVARSILDAVRKEGDAAVIRFTRRFDKNPVTPAKLKIDKTQVQKAYAAADPKVVDSLRYAASRIATFHNRQPPHSWSFQEEGVTLGQQVRPLDSVGLYVPGGKAFYPSSVLMNAIPAKAAGVGRVILCSPCPGGKISPYLLIAADLAGVDELFQVGGAQAIGAMAYGTKIVPKVDKIVGPGNRFVAAAKRLVYGRVDIDMIAGPTEVVIIADDTATPSFIAADLLSQAEHDEDAWSILITTSRPLIRKTQIEMAEQIKTLERRSIATASLKAHGFMIQVKELPEAIEISDAIAPEHLELAVEKPFPLAKQVKHAGAIFLGHYSPQAVGDYIAGPNHVLPTGGTARFSSPLSVEDFIKKSSLIAYSETALSQVYQNVVQIAGVEGLGAHARSVQIRIERREG